MSAKIISNCVPDYKPQCEGKYDGFKITTRTSTWVWKSGGQTAYPSGVQVKRRGWYRLPGPSIGETSPSRGKITRFSSESRSRLRRALLTRRVPDSVMFGVCFTLPWHLPFWGESAMERFRECWNRFGVSFRRTFPTSGMIFRIELTTDPFRRAPHVHAVLSVPCKESGLYRASVREMCEWIRGRMYDLWTPALCKDDPTMHNADLKGYLEHGIMVDPLFDFGGAVRYVADHASKHKQAQLGYKGKQWGFLGERNFEIIDGERLQLQGQPLKQFLRTLRRYRRFTLASNNAPFGGRKTRTLRRAWGVSFIPLPVLRRLVDFVTKTKGYYYEQENAPLIT